MGSPNYSQTATTPELFEQAQLVAVDFDGTTHDTFESAPELGIYGVAEVCKIAVASAFAFDRDAPTRYEDGGGHRNRTPAEIIHELAPYATADRIERLTNKFVAAKLDIFLKQIGRPLADGTPWPRPIPGFIDCWNALSAARQQGQPINTALISAGHIAFIRSAMQVSHVALPDILVTEETMRGLHSPLPPSQLAKPVPLVLMLAKVQWCNMYGAWHNLGSDQLNERITMVGDSIEKDGGLAKNMGVDFIHVGNDPEAAWQSLAQKLKVGSFTTAREVQL